MLLSSLSVFATSVEVIHLYIWGYTGSLVEIRGRPKPPPCLVVATTQAAVLAEDILSRVTETLHTVAPSPSSASASQAQKCPLPGCCEVLAVSWSLAPFSVQRRSPLSTLLRAHGKRMKKWVCAGWGSRVPSLDLHNT